MFCIAVLVAAAVAISAINEVEDHYNDHGSTAYEHADSYRTAAIWLLLVSVMGIIFHSLMILLRYLYLNSCVKSLFSTYAYLVSSRYLSTQRWGSYFLKVTRYLLLLPTAKNISL